MTRIRRTAPAGIKGYLSSAKGLIDKALDVFLPPQTEEPKALHKAMRYSVLSGGKRIRPILVLECARACGAAAAARQAAIASACAVELIHTFSLIHDDLPAMDNDDYRRGKRTCHNVFGEANAILAGDALFALAFNILSKYLPPAPGMAAIRELSDAIGPGGMISGQAMDMHYKDKAASGRTVNTINLLKTARLFEASAQLGAIVAGAGNREKKAMARFGSSLGVAFQIADDMIDQEGYVRFFGADKARRDCEALTLQAKAALAMFGARSNRLKRLADYMAARRK